MQTDALSNSDVGAGQQKDTVFFSIFVFRRFRHVDNDEFSVGRMLPDDLVETNGSRHSAHVLTITARSYVQHILLVGLHSVPQLKSDTYYIFKQLQQSSFNINNFWYGKKSALDSTCSFDKILRTEYELRFSCGARIDVTARYQL